jgi:hypothetical protein
MEMEWNEWNGMDGMDEWNEWEGEWNGMEWTGHQQHRLHLVQQSGPAVE